MRSRHAISCPTGRCQPPFYGTCVPQPAAWPLHPAAVDLGAKVAGKSPGRRAPLALSNRLLRRPVGGQVARGRLADRRALSSGLLRRLARSASAPRRACSHKEEAAAKTQNPLMLQRIIVPQTSGFCWNIRLCSLSWNTVATCAFGKPTVTRRPLHLTIRLAPRLKHFSVATAFRPLN